MTHIYTKLELMDMVQVGKKYVVLNNNMVRIAEVLDDGTARVTSEGALLGCSVDTRRLHFLAEIPEETKEQSIFDNPYYEVEAARLQGKTIQVQRKTGHWCDWDQYDAPKYDAPVDYYRIKPESKTVYRCRYEYEDAYGQSEVCIWTSESALHCDAIKTLYGGSAKFKKWIIEPECTPIEVEVK